MKEWGFEEDSELVDLERIYKELQSLTVIECRFYLENLKEKAPIVYKRFISKYKNIGCLNIEERPMKGEISQETAERLFKIVETSLIFINQIESWIDEGRTESIGLTLKEFKQWKKDLEISLAQAEKELAG